MPKGWKCQAPPVLSLQKFKRINTFITTALVIKVNVVISLLEKKI